MNPPLDADAVVGSTRAWVAGVVIALDLCPFARKPFEADRIRYSVSAATTPKALLADLAAEMDLLAGADPAAVETSLLIHPLVLSDFLEYNDFLDDADALLEAKDLDGVLQIASFHPAYQFADTAPDAAENYTNRSPFPMLHLLREDSLTSLEIDEEALLRIPERNIEKMRELGSAAAAELLRRARAGGTP